MQQFKSVKDTLNNLQIEYQIVDHPIAHSTEEADEYIKDIPGVRTKTLFITDKKKKNFLLLIMDDKKRLDFHQLQTLTGIKRLKMASPELLKQKLGLEPGIVSIFGLIDNPFQDIKVYFDSNIINEDKMTFHPNTNDKTIFLKTKDLLKFVEKMGYEYKLLKLE